MTEFNSNGFGQTFGSGFCQVEGQPEAFSQSGFQYPNGRLVHTIVNPPVEKPAKDPLPVPPRPKKRIIICCDGTWQSSAHGAQTIPSNVAKMSRSIDSWYIDENGLMAPQIVYYDAGVGTAMGKLESLWSGTTGGGLDENVCEAYNFIVNNYSHGDELFFFGFSRGAYTVRACAGLVCRVGICQPSAMGQFWEMYANYKSISASEPLENSLWAKRWEGDPKDKTYQIQVKGEEWEFTKGSGYSWFKQAEKRVIIKVVGVWDTVGSLGYPDNVWTDVSAKNRPYGFHNTEIHPQIENAFHALALEEHRKAFGPTLWSLPEGSNTNLIQCWFPGVHINIGGGSGDGMKDLEQGIGNADGPKKKNTKQERSKGDLEIMSVTTFFWMVDRCHPFLRFKIDPAITDNYKCALSTILERTKTNTKDSKDPKSEHSYGGWGVAPIIDSFQGAMAAAGSETRTPGHYFVDRENAHNHEHHHKRTNEYMHPVVQHAQLQIKYEPEALKGFKRISLGPGKGHHWVKTYKPAEPGLLKRGWSYLTGAAVPSASENDIVSIPEFVIPEHGTNTDGTWWFPYERNLIVTAALRANTGELLPPEKQPSQKDIEVDGEGMQFLNDLDEDNKDVEGFRAWKRQKITSSNPKYPGSW